MKNYYTISLVRLNLLEIYSFKLPTRKKLTYEFYFSEVITKKSKKQMLKSFLGNVFNTSAPYTSIKFSYFSLIKNKYFYFITKYFL